MFLACVCPIECENSDNIAGPEHESHILYGFCCNFSTLSSILNLMYGVPTPSWPRASKHNVRYCFWRSPFPDLSLPEKQLFVFCPYHFNFLPPFPQKNCAAIRALIVRYLSSIMLPNCSAILYGKHDCRSILLSETFVCLGFGNFQSADLIPDYSTVDAQKTGVPIDLASI